jgi:hypothetical protein
LPLLSWQLELESSCFFLLFALAACKCLLPTGRTCAAKLLPTLWDLAARSAAREAAKRALRKIFEISVPFCVLLFFRWKIPRHRLCCAFVRPAGIVLRASRAEQFSLLGARFARTGRALGALRALPHGCYTEVSVTTVIRQAAVVFAGWACSAIYNLPMLYLLSISSASWSLGPWRPLYIAIIIGFSSC